MPFLPVHALAFPLFINTAWHSPFLIRCISIRTGAAFILFVVNTAATTAGTSEYISARSLLPFFLIPQAMPAALKPGTENREPEKRGSGEAGNKDFPFLRFSLSPLLLIT